MKTRFVWTPKLRSLYPILWEWTGLVQSISRDWARENDCVWWYTERALVGTLAAAAWQCGGQALEEYSEDKGRGAKRYTGRCDLYLYSRSTDFVAEAKLAWCEIGAQSESGMSSAANGLRDARKAARKLNGGADKRIAIAFAVPRYPARQSSQGEKRLSEWQANFRKHFSSGEAGALAWIFPTTTRTLTHEKYVYPGVALVAEEIPWK